LNTRVLWHNERENSNLKVVNCGLLLVNPIQILDMTASKMPLGPTLVGSATVMKLFSVYGSLQRYGGASM